ADQGLRHPRDRGGDTVTTEVQVVGQDAGPQRDEALPGAAGVARRAWDNIRTGTLGVLPIVRGVAVIVILFSFQANSFVTADTFNNIIVQMAQTCMLAFGVVFVLRLGEIDLSIA